MTPALDGLSAKLAAKQVCDWEDVAHLRALLSADAQIPSRPQSVASHARPAVKKTPAHSRAKSTAKITPPPPQSNGRVPTLQQRHKIATECANYALNALSAVAAKLSSTGQGAPAGAHLKEVPPNKKHGGVHHNTDRFVDPQVNGSPVLSPAFAELGFESFRFLLSREALVLSTKSKSGSGHFFAASFAFAGKLIALDYLDVAAKHLCQLHTQLQAGNDLSLVPSKSTVKRTNPVLMTRTETNGKHVAQLLIFDSVRMKDPDHLDQLHSFQMLVLRFMARYPTAADLEQALPHLDHAIKSSPVNILLYRSRLKLAPEKTALQLDSLSKILSYCASKLSIESDTDFNNTAIIFRLQVSGLCARIAWTAVSERQGHHDKEIVQPFVSALKIYMCTASNTSNQRHALVQGLCRDLEDFATKHGTRSEPRLTENRDVRLLLGCLAYDAGLLDDAQESIEDTLTGKHQLHDSDALDFMSAMRLGKAVFGSRLSAEDEEQAWLYLSHASHLLRDGFRDGGIPFESILGDAIQLRNTAYEYMRKVVVTRSIDDVTSQAQFVTCFELQGHVTILLLRNLSLRVGKQSIAAAKALEKRQHICFRAVQRSFDAIINSTRQASRLAWFPYEPIIKALGTAVALLSQLRGLDRSADIDCLKDEDLHKLTADVAKSYFLATKSGEQSKDDLILCVKVLQEGIGLLTANSASTKRIAQQSLGYYRLGRVFLKLHKKASAKNTFEASLKASVEGGIAAEATSLANTEPMHEILNSGSDFQILHSATRALVELEIAEDSPPITVYMSMIENRNDRVILLESRLTNLLEWSSKNSASRKAHELITLTINELLSSYEASEFPLRHRRLKAIAAPFTNDAQSPVTDLKILEDEQNTDDALELGQDIGLERFKDHIFASVAAACGLCNRLENVVYLGRAINLWASMLEAVTSWPDVETRVDDTHAWLSLLDTICDFLDMQGYDPQKIQCLALIARITSLDPHQTPESRASRLLNVGKALIPMGHSDAAKQWIDAAASELETSTSEPNFKVELTRAQWSLANGDFLKSQEHMNPLQKHLQNFPDEPKTLMIVSFAGTLPPKAQEILFVSEVFSLYAALSFKRKDLFDSLLFAKRSVTLLNHVWRIIESKYGLEPKDNDDTLAAVDALTKSLSRMSITPRKSRSEQHEGIKIPGPAFWPLSRQLCQALLQLSRMLKHVGSLQGALTACDQAQKLADTTDAPMLKAEVMVELAELNWRSGNAEEARSMFHMAETFFTQYGGPSRNEANALLAMGDYYRHRQSWRNEHDVYARAEGIIESLETPDFLQDVSRMLVLSSKHTSKPSSTSAAASRATDSQQDSRNKQRLKQNTRKPVGHARKPSKMATTLTEDLRFMTQFELVKRSILAHQVESMLAQKNLMAAAKFLQKLEGWRTGRDSKCAEAILQASLSLYEALASMAAHAIYSMLPESTLSLPNIPLLLHQESATRDRRTEKETVNKELNGRQQQSNEVKSTGQEDILDALKRASDITSSMSSELDLHTNGDIFRALEIMANCSMLLSFAGSASGGQKSRPIELASYLDLHKSVATLREHMSIESELANKACGTSLLWPVSRSPSPTTFKLTISDLEQDLYQALPDAWTVVSLNIHEQHEHLYITRYDARKSPFVLRLPLNRQTGDDLEEESFSLAEAQDELSSIIQDSDAIVHQATDSPDDLKVRGAKTQWWADREELDARLHSLLMNMENIWLGGFRSIFSPHHSRGEAFERFKEAFALNLTRHLPSRQANSRMNKAHQVALDDDVIELFTGLMIYEEDGVADLDEALNDLLYFVVDILQYNGEANAYDEIDFDAIIVELQDALLDFRDALSTESTSRASGRQLVLVLDKQLHMFPWESMPCLEGRSVSRVLSIKDLIDRLRLMHSQSNVEIQGVAVSKAGGTYILNPGKDLPRTQTRFEKPLSHLQVSGWSNHVGEAPSENQFESALTRGIQGSSRSILLYIGHGSGAQYVRAKTIRRLRPLCNAVLLFGCSSASLKGAGEFEAHGTPRNYLAAGAPAVLGSLWDVTDGDVDKFAGAVLERWGLLEAGSCEEAAQQKGKGKGRQKGKSKGTSASKTAIKEAGMARASLSDAVASSRELCYLRYLNGAAMVVYGIPVYLG